MASVVPSVRTAEDFASVDIDDRVGLGFALLLVTMTTLFIRPADLIPALDKLPIYQGLIIVCLVVGARSIIRQLGQVHLHLQPVTACLLALLFAAGLSHLSHGFLWGARTSMWEIGKLVAFYLLIVGLVNTPQRLALFLKLIASAICVTAALALLDRLGVISIAALESIRDRAGTGGVETVERIRGTGIFHDPNDFGLILVTGLIISTGFLFRRAVGWPRLFWLPPTVLLIVVLAMTHSRGAFLSVACAFPAAIIYHRNRKLKFLLLLALPLTAAIFSGRMTDLNAIREGTGQSRLQIWSDSLMTWKRNPIFGLGEGQLVDELGVVAHNSFIHCFAELGVLGGMAFVACFMAAGWGLWKSRGEPTVSIQTGTLSAKSTRTASCQLREDHDRMLAQMRAIVFAALAAYLGGMMALSRQFTTPTFLVLGLAATAQWLPRSAPGPFRLNSSFALAVAAISLAVLAVFHLAVRLFVAW